MTRSVSPHACARRGAIARLARRVRGVPFVAAVALLVDTPRPLMAQPSVAIPGTCSTGVSPNSDCRMAITISTTIQATRRLVVAPGTTFALVPSSGQLSAADFDAGFFDASGSIRLQVQSNAAWRVTLQATSAAMTGGCTNKQASSILWGLSAATRSTPVAAVSTTVFSGTAFTAGDTRDVFLRVGLGWLTDGPVSAPNCTLPVSFAVGAP